MEKHNSLARLADFSTACLITLFGMGLILCTKGVSAAAQHALMLCGRVVIPSLFPFLVLSTLMLSCGPGEILTRLLSRPMEIFFRLPGSCAPALVMGLIGGYPVGARTAFELYDRHACTAEECSRLLAFCSCCGPSFLFSAAGMVIFGSLQAGLILWLCHITAALLIGWVQGRFLPKVTHRSAAAHKVERLPFARAFTHAVTAAGSTMLNVCAFVIFFAALMALLEESGWMAALCRALSFLPYGMADALVRGLLEMTGGIASLGSAHALSFPQAMGMAGLIAGWGGLSVHAQVLSLREDRDIAMGRYFIGKGACGLLAGLMSYGASLYFLQDLPLHTVFRPEYVPGAVTVTNPLYYILVCGVYLVTCLAVTGLVLWLEDRDARKGCCQNAQKTV